MAGKTPVQNTVIYVSLVDQVVATITGHSFRFEAGVPRSIPNHNLVLKAVREAGCVDVNSITDEKLRASLKLTGTPGEAPTVDDQINGEVADREDKILAAIKTLVDRGDAADFASGGKPKTEAIASVTGFEVKANERDAVWKLYQSDKPE